MIRDVTVCYKIHVCLNFPPNSRPLQACKMCTQNIPVSKCWWLLAGLFPHALRQQTPHFLLLCLYALFVSCFQLYIKKIKVSLDITTLQLPLITVCAAGVNRVCYNAKQLFWRLAVTFAFSHLPKYIQKFRFIKQQSKKVISGSTAGWEEHLSLVCKNNYIKMK